MNLFDFGTIPSTSRVARLRGGEALQPEHSVNFRPSAVGDAGAFSLTADYFRIRVYPQCPSVHADGWQGRPRGGPYPDEVMSSRLNSSMRDDVDSRSGPAEGCAPRNLGHRRG